MNLTLLYICIMFISLLYCLSTLSPIPVPNSPQSTLKSLFEKLVLCIISWFCMQENMLVLSRDTSWLQSGNKNVVTFGPITTEDMA